MISKYVNNYSNYFMCVQSVTLNSVIIGIIFLKEAVDKHSFKS